MYKKAIKGKFFMGLNNRICYDPKYWCRLHEIYLSEKDVERKHCKCKCSANLLDTYICGNLEDVSND